MSGAAIGRAALDTAASSPVAIDAVANHLGGLVYQLLLRTDASLAFPYLSEGCTALLGLDAAALRRAPGLFADLIVPEDRRAYRATMAASAAALARWEWEGRIRSDAWQGVKWIALCASPRALADPAGGVQWEGVMRDISAAKRTQEELGAARARLAELVADSDRIKEQERRRIAREIHDELGGNLTAIKMALAMLTRRLPDAPQLAERAAYVDTLVDRSIDAVHRIALELHPPMLELGIVAALAWRLGEFERQMGIACSFSAGDAKAGLAPDRATSLFRMFEEALTNIARHARASRVAVRLRCLPEQWILTIGDNGVGIAQADRAKPASLGLRGMGERALALGGTVALTPAVGGGTVVTIKIAPEATKQPIIAATDIPDDAQASKPCP